MKALETVRAAVESDHFAAAEALVRAVEWRHALASTYRARVEIDLNIPDYDAQVLLGSDLRLVLGRGASARSQLCGLVGSVHEGATLDTGARVTLEIIPAFELLSFRRRSRIFQDKTAVEIVSDVLGTELGTYGRTFSDQLTGQYKKREYCVQYQESDRDFVQRLLEEEGIWFSFDHSGSVEELSLFDDNASAPRVTDGDNGALPYRSVDESQESVVFARLAAEATATSVATRQYDWTSVVNQEATDTGDDPGPSAERYEHGHGFMLTLADFSGSYGSHDAVQRARVWREALTSPRIRLSGRSTAIGFYPGCLFELAEHPVADANVEYLLVSVTHRLAAAPGDRVAHLSYENAFEAQPSDRPFRPPRVTRRPAVHSIETAIVTGPSGEEVHTDEHGRIKVQFHWDRDGQNDENTSCWVRCAQDWAGAGWGFVFTPRIGMEAIIRFEEGDPDRPLATGTLYTGTNTPPYSLPGEKTKSAAKSNSSLGGGGFNELRFDDTAGSEEFFQNGQYDFNEKVLNNHSTHVIVDQLNEVDVDQDQIIHGDQTEKIATTQDLEVLGTREVTVDSGFEEHVKGKQTRTVSAGSTESISGHETHEVLDGGLIELITGHEKSTVKSGGLTETIHDSHALIVTGAVTETITGKMDRQAPSILHDASASISYTGTGGMDVNGGVQISINAPSYFDVTPNRGKSRSKSEEVTPTKWEAFILSAEAAGLKMEDTSFKLDVSLVKNDMSGISSSIGAATVTMALKKKEMSGPELKGNCFLFLLKAIKKKD